METFKNDIFLLFSFVTLSLPAKNYASITKSVNLAPWAPFLFSFRTGKRQNIPLRTYIVREWPTKVLASRFFSVAKVKIISKKQPNRDPKAKTVKKKNAIEKRKKKYWPVCKIKYGEDIPSYLMSGSPLKRPAAW